MAQAMLVVRKWEEKMTVKLMIMLDRKPGMTDEQFKKRYEEGHAPLARTIFPTMVEYRRNFVGEVAVGERPPCDCITEMVFVDRAAYDDAMAALADPAKADALANDELELFNRSTFRAFLVDERSSDI
jgi:hypothetical protein